MMTWEEERAAAKAVVDAVAPALDADPAWRDRLYRDLDNGDIDGDDIAESALNAAVTFDVVLAMDVLAGARQVADESGQIPNGDNPVTYIYRHLAVLEQRTTLSPA